MITPAHKRTLTTLAQPPDDRQYWKPPSDDEAPPPRKNNYHIVGRVEHLIRAALAVNADEYLLSGRSRARDSATPQLNQWLEAVALPSSDSDTEDIQYTAYREDTFHQQLTQHLQSQVSTALANTELGDPYLEAAIYDAIPFEQIAHNRQKFFQRLIKREESSRVAKALGLVRARPDTDIDARVHAATYEEFEPLVFQAAIVCAHTDQVNTVKAQLQDTTEQWDSVSTVGLPQYSPSVSSDTGCLALVEAPELDAEIDLERDAHLDLPHPLIIAQSPSGSSYPFVPWHGVVTCTCGDKIELPWKHPLCKHEIAALLLENLHGFADSITGPIAPSRLTRLVHASSIRHLQNAANTPP